MKSRPTILISGCTERRGQEMGDTSLSLALNYPLAIQAAGGMPWLLPCLPTADFVAEAVRCCDGVLLTGGDDVQPRLYEAHVPSKLLRTVRAETPERDLFELLLIDEAFRQRKPLLAICRGQQILNVALGGNLIVDIPAQIPRALKHRQIDRKYEIVHEVKVQPGSLLAQAVGQTRLGVNSTHHQAVAQVAKPLRITAVSIDGVVEALELKPEARQRLPYLLAVQFHPERLFRGHPEHLALFKSFTRASQQLRRRKS
jgi:putative glutamine amidotransferase